MRIQIIDPTLFTRILPQLILHDLPLWSLLCTHIQLCCPLSPSAIFLEKPQPNFYPTLSLLCTKAFLAEKG